MSAANQVDRIGAVLALGASAITVGSASTLLLSIVYECGYFFQIGLQYMSLAGLTDHVSNAFSWMPLVFIFLAVNFVFFRLINLGLTGPTETMLLAIAITTIPGLIFVVLFTPRLTVLEFIVASIMVTSPVINVFFVRIMAYGFLVGPTVFAVATTLFLGQANLVNDFAERDPATVVTIQIKGEPLRGHILRTYEKGLLILPDGERVIRFLRWDGTGIEFASEPMDLQRRRPLACIWFGVMCP